MKKAFTNENTAPKRYFLKFRGSKKYREPLTLPLNRSP
jgi:hypothetical protein